MNEKMLRTLLLLLITAVQIMSAVPLHAMDKAEIGRLYHEGEASFRRANELVSANPQKAEDLYRKAVLAFERIMDEGGVENGKLYYNTGNIYFRLGDIGRAILYYRSAEKLIPNDLNLHQNLDYARSRRVDKIEEKPQTQIFKTIFFWHYDLSRFIRAFLFTVFFNLIWLCAGIYLFKRKALLRYGMMTGCILSLLLAGSLGLEAFQDSRTRAGVVLAPEVVARKGDSTTYQPSFNEPLHAGTEFSLIEERKGWYHIELTDGRRCWIPDAAAGLVR